MTVQCIKTINLSKIAKYFLLQTLVSLLGHAKLCVVYLKIDFRTLQKYNRRRLSRKTLHN